MVQITQNGLEVQPGAVEFLRAAFEKKGFAVIPNFLASSVLKPLLKQLESTRFTLKQELLVMGCTQIVPVSDPIMACLHFIINRPELFQAVSQISGIPRPGNFTSRLHKTCASPYQHIDWHDDGGMDRVLGLNINLSTQPYGGGLLQLRNPDGRMMGQVGQLPPGDAFLFRVAKRWEHRLTPVEFGERTVAVGWFRTGPDWTENAMSWFRTGTIHLEEEANG
jgi:hypothetical protein